jgi:hypothetical protein
MRLTRIILGIGLFAVLGCGDRSEPVTLEPARQEANTAGEPTARSSRERFGYTAAPAEGAGTLKAPFAGSGASPADPSSLHWSVPAGWTQGPARRMREVTFFLDAAQSAECYVTVLPGAAGGVAANLKRWYGQMGHEPPGDADLGQLPSMDCLGVKAPLLLLEGTYTGMGGVNIPESLFAGTVVQQGGQTIFVKMVGPKTIAEPNLEQFKAFCASLHDGQGHSHGAE